MTRHFQQNIEVPVLGEACDLAFFFKEAALAAGWTMLQYGSGTPGGVYDHTGFDGITRDNIRLSGTWFLLAMPGGDRKFLFSHYNSTVPSRMYIGYSATGDYNDDGSATAPCTVNTAVENAIIGTYSPRAVGDFSNGSYAQYLQVMCNDTDPYDFYALLTMPGSGTPYTIFLGTKVESPSSSDTDPFIIHARYTSSALLTTDMGQAYTAGYISLNVFTLFYMAFPVAFATSGYVNAIGGSENGIGPSRYDGKEVVTPIMVIRGNLAGLPIGYKGMIRTPCLPTSRKHGNGEVVSVDSVGDHVAYGDVLLPWNNVVPRT